MRVTGPRSKRSWTFDSGDKAALSWGLCGSSAFGTATGACAIAGMEGRVELVFPGWSKKVRGGWGVPPLGKTDWKASDCPWRCECRKRVLCAHRPRCCCLNYPHHRSTLCVVRPRLSRSLAPNDRGERPLPTGTVERRKHTRIAIRPRTEKRGGGGSLDRSCSAIQSTSS